MRIISKKTLRDFWKKAKYKDSEQPLKAWHAEIKIANLNKMSELKQLYGDISVVGNVRVVFNIGGNKYRLIVKIRFDMKIVFIRFIGTNKQYDNNNAKEV